MARIRTIKPDFFRHDGLYNAEQETGLPLRIAFAGLWTACDREGRFEWKPVQLKLDCLPFDEVDFARVLDALLTRGYLVKYEVEGAVFGHIPTWRKHQVINNRESASRLPEPNKINEMPTRAARVADASTTRHELAQAEVEVEGKGKGSETTPAIVDRTTAPESAAAGAVDLESLRIGLPAGSAEGDKAAELWACLHANGCKGTASHPSVIEMSRQGVTIDLLKRAIVEARKTREGPLNPAYLAAIIDRLKTERPAKHGAWMTSDHDCELKAAELGIKARPLETYGELRARIRAELEKRADASVR